MPKSATALESKDVFEQLYAEAEARIEAKFNRRIAALEKTVADLRRECNEWKEEAHVWKTKYYAEQKRAEKLEGQLSLAREEIKELKEVVQKQSKQITALQKQLYGRKTEVVAVEPEAEPLPEKRQRGRQSGTKGSGRRTRPDLETVEKIHKFEPVDLVCPCCNLPFEDAGEKRSEEIDFDVKVTRISHRRKTVRKTCKCPTTPTVKTPPAPARLFKGSSFSVGVWHYVIHDKYHLQRPLSRTLKYLESHGLPIGSSVMVNGFKRLHDKAVLKPLVEDIRARVIASDRQQKDETGWKIFQEIEGKEGYQHWLWVTLSKDCALFEVDPSRSREVAKRTIGETPVVVTTDMLKVYNDLGDNVTNSWCWAHVRRYLLGLSKSSAAWVAKVDWLYHCNNLRLRAKNKTEFEACENDLRTALSKFERQVKSNAIRHADEESRKVFKMIANHWHGLSLFADLPEIPMDNNLSEQALRNAVVGRKCYYGSGSCWSGEFAADLFSIFTTLEMNGINTRTWLFEYLAAVAANGGKAPRNAVEFLPWNSPPVHFLSN
jgi:transposase